MNEKAAQGTYPSRAPYGYLNVRENGQSFIKIDPIAAPYVVKIFDLYATGTYGLKSVCQQMIADGMVYKNGQKLHTSKIEAILKNEFYTGVFT